MLIEKLNGLMSEFIRQKNTLTNSYSELQKWISHCFPFVPFGSLNTNTHTETFWYSQSFIAYFNVKQ